MAENALAHTHILELATACLRGDEVNLKNPYEAVALVGHACMLAVDFRLIGLGEDHRIEHSEEPSKRLPNEWNANSTYAFKYAHAQSSMQYLLKVSRLGNNAVVFALALGDDKTTSFDIAVKDYISESSLPLPSNPTNLSDALRDVFISAARLGDLISLFKLNVIQRLAPGLQKEGYEDTRQETRRGEPVRQPREDEPPRDPLRDPHLPEPARPYPFNDPLAAPPRPPIPAGDFPPPGFEDEYEINRPPRGFHPGYGERRPLNIGERDLYPPGLGPHDPLRGHFGPTGGGGGGMHPTYDDPIFGGRGNRQGYDPQVPPGARYDPVGPGDERPMGRGQGSHFPGGGRSGGFGGFGSFGQSGGFGGDII
ncbi:hypothetical protein VTO42DRAFT_7727 [Malbranchea cinnamomea]